MRSAISEWRWSPRVIGDYASARAISEAEAERAIGRLGERIQKSLRLGKSPIVTSSGGILAKGIAGIAGLDSDFEIEIMPKYVHSANRHWRQDLLFMSMVSKHGDLLLHDQIRATPSAANDLASFVAEVLLRLFYSNRRTPLKKYRFVSYQDFTLDGDFDAENLLLPGTDGFVQHRFQFDTDNEYSATVKTAVETLSRTIRDPSILSRLRRLSADIGRVTTPPSKRRCVLPGRLRRWQTLYDLSFDISRGFGLSPGDSVHKIPGFIVSTWQIWQDLIARALVMAFGNYAVKNQRRYPLGQSWKAGKGTIVNTTPDSVLSNLCPALIVDAKYKARNDIAFDGINEVDFYETLAFMRGANTNRAILVYPASTTHPRQTGSTEIIEKIQLSDGETIWGVSLEVNGISESGGFLSFINGLKKCVVDLTTPAMSSEQGVCTVAASIV